MNKSVAKFNTSTPKFDVNMKGDFKYYKLEDIYTMKGKDSVSPILAIFFNKGKFGTQATVFTGCEYVNIPNHLTGTLQDILSEMLPEINLGLIGFKVYEYYNETYAKNCYSMNFVDIPKVVDGENIPF